MHTFTYSLRTALHTVLCIPRVCNGRYIFTIAMHCFQIYDTGVIEGSPGLFKVSNVQIFGGYIVHIGSFDDNAGRFHVGDRVVCKVSFLMCLLVRFLLYLSHNHGCSAALGRLTMIGVHKLHPIILVHIC